MTTDPTETADEDQAAKDALDAEIADILRPHRHDRAKDIALFAVMLVVALGVVGAGGWWLFTSDPGTGDTSGQECAEDRFGQPAYCPD